MAHCEPPHQDLRCLQIQLFSSLVIKELLSEIEKREAKKSGVASPVGIPIHLNTLSYWRYLAVVDLLDFRIPPFRKMHLPGAFDRINTVHY